MIIDDIAEVHFDFPTQCRQVEPDYFVFFWGPAENIEGGEPERHRWGYQISQADDVGQVIGWAQEQADGRMFAVMLGVPMRNHLGEPCWQLFVLAGEYPKESEYTGPGFKGCFFAPQGGELQQENSPDEDYA